MNSYKSILIILIVFLKTGNVFSEVNIFNVNNIELTKKENTSYQKMANIAMQKGFNELINKILLDQDVKKISKIDKAQIKSLVSYYQVINKNSNNENEDKFIFNIFFDKDKIHNLFFNKEIFYSEIEKKELYILPILKVEDQVYIYNKNFFYEKWNEINNFKLLEFILPLENIEIIQKINSNKNNLLNIDLKDIFKEYSNNNLAFVIVDNPLKKDEKIYLKTKILGKNIDKNILIKKQNLDKKQYYEEIINEISNEITNIVKSQNLIDIRTPSFLNTKLIMSKKNNLVELNKRLEKIDLIDNINVQEFNNEYVLIKLRYLGKLNKIIKQLEDEKILLKLDGDEWSLNII